MPGLFSFKNYQLMRVTDSLFRRSGRAVAKPIGVNLRKYFVYFDKKSVAKWRHLLHNVENDFN